MDGAKNFLARVLPWDGVSWCGVFHKEGASGGMFGRPVKNVADALKEVNYRKHRGRADIYVSLASQKAVTERKSTKTGNAFLTANRDLPGFAKNKSLYLDLDVKVGAYRDTRDALMALLTAVQECALPEPTALVASGSGGVHAYWILSELLDYPQWYVLAEALAEWAAKRGLKYDRQCTVDGVRVLRVPDTSNFKSNPPNPVRLLKMRDRDIPLNEMVEALEPYKISGSHGRALADMGLGDSDELSAGVETKARPRDIDQIAAVCPFVWDTLDTGGAGLANPCWSQTVLIASFCENPEETAHRLSCGHKAYTWEETQRQIERRLKDREGAARVGFPSCRAIHNAGALQCATCPHFAEQTSPLKIEPPPVLASGAPKAATGTQALAVTQDLRLPHYAYADGAGFIFREDANEDGKKVATPIFRQPVSDVWITSKPVYVLHFKTLTHEGERDVSIKFGDALNKQKVVDIFANDGVVVYPNDEWMAFMRDWLTELREARDKLSTSTMFGWVEQDGEIEGFAYGGQLFTPTGNRPTAMLEGEIRKQFQPQGSIAHWIAAAKLVTDQKRPDMDCLIASSFAGPLVRFTAHNGLTFGTYSPESGIGKSTALNIAQAVWGNPVRAMQGLNDTENSTIQKLGLLNSIPTFVDEIKTAGDSEAFINSIFRVSGGKGRARLKQDASFRETPTWQTLLVYASNDSLYDYVVRGSKSTVAGHMRVFEYRSVPVPHTLNVSHVTKVIGGLKQNYGQAGSIYAKYLGQNHKAIAKRVVSLDNSLAQKLRIEPEERFWLGAITVLLCGAEIANSLGLTTFDIPAMLKFLTAELQRMRHARQQAPNDFGKPRNIEAILARFLSEQRQRGTIHTNKVWNISGKPHGITYRETPQNLGDVIVQIGTEDKVMLVSLDGLTGWLVRNTIPQRAFLDAATRHMNVKQVRRRIGSGTPVVSGYQNILEFDLKGSTFEALADF